MRDVPGYTRGWIGVPGYTLGERCTLVGIVLPGTLVGIVLPGTLVGIHHPAYTPPLHPGYTTYPPSSRVHEQQRGAHRYVRADGALGSNLCLIW